MKGNIDIRDISGDRTVIKIEGTIGVPEVWQFEDPGERIATYEKLSSYIEAISKLSSENITVEIRSSGGNVNDALMIYDALKRTGSKITTVCYGYVASAATIIAQAADRGQRYISENGLYLIHCAECTVEGNRQEISAASDLLAKTDERIIHIYAENSGKEKEVIAGLMAENGGKGRWLDAGEAIGYGLVDRISPSSEINPGAAITVSNMGLPPLPSGYTKAPQPPSDREAPENGITIKEDIENIRRRATRTKTNRCEDPSQEGGKLNSNTLSYLEDIKNIIENH